METGFQTAGGTYDAYLKAARRAEAAAMAAFAIPDHYISETEAPKRATPRGTWNQVPSILAGMENVGRSRFYVPGDFDPDDTECKLGKLT